MLNYIKGLIKKKTITQTHFKTSTLETKTNFVQYSYILDAIVDQCVLCTYFSTLDMILDRHVVNLRTVNV